MIAVRPDILYAWRGPGLLVTDRASQVGEYPQSGFFWREARFLSRLQLLVDGRRPWLCEVAAPEADRLVTTWIHPEDAHLGGKDETGLQDDTLAVDDFGLLKRALDLTLTLRLEPAALSVDLEVGCHVQQAVEVTIAFALAADFVDVVEAGDGQPRAPTAADPLEQGLLLRHLHPELPYATKILGNGPVEWQILVDGAGLSARLRLEPQTTVRLGLRVLPVDSEPVPDDAQVRDRQALLAEWQAQQARVECPGHLAIEQVVRQAQADLASMPLLEGQSDEWLAPAAGMPNYPALFGRDAVTAAWQMAMLDRGRMLDASLTRLGRLQGTRDDPWYDEEPGRLPYQVRRGPQARLKLNPYARYFADFASPLMYLIALGQLYAWSGRRQDIERHWDVARRIADWARDRGDRDGDGYLEYLTRSPLGTKHQGWKDSGNAILYADGRRVPAPIAPCEVQGYWYAAQQTLAVLSWVMDDKAAARAYWRSALELKQRFDRDFWIEDERCVALCLDPDKRAVPVPTSNAGHCLATGIVATPRVRALARRLLEPDLFSGWGVRTLTTRHPLYHPLSYHVGSVWVVENATTLLGMRRYGLNEEAERLMTAMADLALLYPDRRVPECVGGHARQARTTPGAFPHACTPQTWNCSAYVLWLQMVLGLQPVAPLHTLAVDPLLPAWLPEIVVRDLRLGEAVVTLHAWRDSAGRSHVQVLEQRGTLHLLRQPPPEDVHAGFWTRLGALVAGAFDR